MTTTLTPSHTLDLTPKKKARRGKYDQETLDALLAKAEKLPEEMTPAMEEEVRKYEKHLETMKNPQLEPKNYKIDQGKSKTEKLREGWKEEERLADIDGSKRTIKILKKELAPGAFVWEYQDDGEIPKHMIGEQLFNWKAVLSLGLQDRLPTWENMVAMRGKTFEENQTFLKNNFQKDGKNLFPGYWLPNLKKFIYISKCTDCWLAFGDNVSLDKDFMSHFSHGHESGFSLRLFKN